MSVYMCMMRMLLVLCSGYGHLVSNRSQVMTATTSPLQNSTSWSRLMVTLFRMSTPILVGDNCMDGENP